MTAEPRSTHSHTWSPSDKRIDDAAADNIEMTDADPSSGQIVTTSINPI